MSTHLDLRPLFGNLADEILPHLRGRMIPAVRGLSALSSAVDGDPGEIPGLALPLLGYQRAGVEYIRKARRVLVGDEMGLGKTPQAIASVVAEQTFPALVVCPPSLTLNWVREFSKFAPSVRVHRIVGRTVTDLPEADVYVIGDSVVAAWQDPAIALGLRALVVDESHRIKDRTRNRTKTVIEIARKVDNEGLVLLLSGTPVKNRHTEIISQLIALGVLESLFGSVNDFLGTFAPKVDQYKREDANGVMLHKTLIDSCYIRRRRSDMVDADGNPLTPGKDRVAVAVEMDTKGLAAYKKAEDDLRSFLRGEGRTERQIEKAMKAEALVLLGVLRRTIGVAKIPAVTEYVNNIVEQGDQVLVFASHREVVKAYAKAFDADTIMGGDSVESVEKAKARFQAGETRVLVLNIEAGGVGHNLTAASHVVFAEFDWTPGGMTQAEDRADRIGQTRRVLAHWVMGANGSPTVDEHVVGLINDKAESVGALTDGQGETLLDSDSITSALLDAYR
jgi:SNF2 family DNA or RNA helicase